MRDHPVFREGLSTIIGSQPDMLLVAQAVNAVEAIDEFRRHRPDVTLMDLRLPSTNGTDTLIAIRGEFPQARIIILTTSDSDGEIKRALTAGASAYILKSMPKNELLAVICSVHSGHRQVPPEVAARIAEHLGEEDPTNRELEVLRLIRDGYRNIITFLFVILVLYRLRVRQIASVMSARFDERLAERTRLARELHDTFLQTIQGSKMVAGDALEQSGDPVRLRRAIEQLSIWLGQAVNEGRAALNSLRTSTTEKNDLAAALQRATDTSAVQGSMAPTFSVVGEAKDMHPIVRDEIYRIGYEAIRNACMHSGASRLELELRYEKDLVVRVKDNGKGIDPVIASEGKDGHFGLKGMRERTTRIGAKLTLDTSATSGTEITLVVPGDIAFRISNPLE